jgi:hypothetical protein
VINDLTHWDYKFNYAEGDAWQGIEDKSSRNSDRYIGDGEMDLTVKLIEIRRDGISDPWEQKPVVLSHDCSTC